MAVNCWVKLIEADKILNFLTRPEQVIDQLPDETTTLHSNADEAIHFLLTGRPAFEGSAPEAMLTVGGLVTREYRVLRPHEVEAYANVLQAICRADLHRRYDPNALNDAGIQPENWTAQDFEAIADSFDKLRYVVIKAANERKGLIISFG